MTEPFMTGSKKYKVLLTLNNNRLSGIERFAVLVAEFIDDSLFDITIALPSRGKLCDLLEEKGIKYIIFNKSGKRPYSLSGIKTLFFHFLNNKYDIIHAQAGIVPCVLGKFFGFRLLVEHKHGLDFTIEALNNFGVIRMAYESIKKYFTDYTMTVCDADRKILIDRFGYNPKKVRTLYNGIVKDVSLNNKIPAEKNITVIGTVGRLTYQKGQEYFIEMADILVNRDKIKNLMFEIWGDGENREYYDSLIKEYKLAEYVFLKGYSGKSAEVYSNFDIFVLTSRYEGIPYVILEAMNAKLPIISTDVGGIKEILKNNNNGLLVEKENPEILAVSVKKLMDSPELRTRLAEKASEDFNSKYLIQNTVENLTNFYKEALNDT